VYSGIATKVYDVLSTYAKENSYSLVLDVAGQQTPILYALPTTDITKTIIEAYNVKSGVPAPPPAAPTPAGTTPSAPKPAPTGPSGN
jgi:outer membrane protein